MKKRDQENRTRRLALSRETIRSLEDPQLLEQVVGGTSQWRICPDTQLSTEGC